MYKTILHDVQKLTKFEHGLPSKELEIYFFVNVIP